MNTIGSVYYGWAFLIACGGGSYYFAKRSINAERYERQAHENELRMRRQRQMANSTLSQPTQPSTQPQKVAPSGSGGKSPGGSLADHSFNPSKEASADPAPTDRSPGDSSAPSPAETQYEAVRPFRSKKGDRFS